MEMTNTFPKVWLSTILRIPPDNSKEEMPSVPYYFQR